MIRGAVGALALTVAVTALAISSVSTGDLRLASWTEFGALSQPRSFATAVALPSGEILVVGGLDPRDPQVTNESVELIDPLSKGVTVLPQHLVGRLHQTATIAGDRVIMAGGVEWAIDHWTPLDRVEVYDAASRTWLTAKPLFVSRSDHAAVALRDGRVMVIGGNHDTKLLDSTELYDPRTNSWTVGARMPRPRTQHTAVVLRDGRVMVLGGIDSDGGPTDTTFLYDPDANTWVDGPHLTMPRLQQATVVLPSGDVLLAGGNGVAAKTSEIYSAKAHRFIASGVLVDPRYVPQMAALPDGRVVVTGGLPPVMTAYRPISSSEIWDPQSGTWRALAPLSEPRAWGTLLRVGSSLYLVSGNGSDETAFRSVERLPID